jgi:uncharacterized membrane protein YphA (DoxX/SURF4 family)
MVKVPEKDKPPIGRATQIAARIIAAILATIWVYFGVLYLTGEPGECRVVNQTLGYPPYIIPFIGVTHILGGMGLLLPNRTRLTDWIYAGLTYDLILAAFSHIRSGSSIGEALDPVMVGVFVIASYILRQRTNANLWAST